MSCFYVYEHWRPNTNKCFYVGKGKGKRAWDLQNMRNPHFKSVVSKLTFLGFSIDVRIIKSELSEDEALSLEIERIAMYGIDNLTNMTLGGDGMKNPTDETRAKMSASQKKRFQNPIEKEKMSIVRKGRVTSEKTKIKLSIAGTGKKHTPETIEKMKIAAKKRGISPITRAAQKMAITGRKRSPFSNETRQRMSESAKKREHLRRSREV